MHNGLVGELRKCGDFYASRRQHRDRPPSHPDVPEDAGVQQAQKRVPIPARPVPRAELHSVFAVRETRRPRIVLPPGDGGATFRHDLVEFGAVLDLLLRRPQSDSVDLGCGHAPGGFHDGTGPLVELHRRSFAQRVSDGAPRRPRSHEEAPREEPGRGQSRRFRFYSVVLRTQVYADCRRRDSFVRRNLGRPLCGVVCGSELHLPILLSAHGPPMEARFLDAVDCQTDRCVHRTVAFW